MQPFPTLLFIPALLTAAEIRTEQDVDCLGGGCQEKADLYFPASPKPGQKFPAVPIIHVGVWSDGDMRAAREINIGTALAQGGYVGMSINCVLATSTNTAPTWPQNLHDCKNVVRWLRKNAERLQTDPERIGVTGGSAGGHLSAMVALTGTELDPPGTGSCRVQCAVDLHGPVLWFEQRDIATNDCAAVPQSTKVRSPLGIGFLWTTQSDRVVSRLDGTRDFVDVILGPGKLDVIQQVRPPARVACIARSLEKDPSRPFPGLKETIATLRRAKVSPDRVILAYNPESQPGTPAAEIRELVASCRKAKELARNYGAPLLVGPGLREMSKREELYPELAKTCDIWLIQSQRLQLDEVTRKPVPVAQYREQVKRITVALRRGNPRLRVFVQLVATAERGSTVLSAPQVAAFARSVEDLVDAVRIYGAPGDQLRAIIDELRGPVPTKQPQP